MIDTKPLEFFHNPFSFTCFFLIIQCADVCVNSLHSFLSNTVLFLYIHVSQILKSRLASLNLGFWPFFGKNDTTVPSAYFSKQSVFMQYNFSSLFYHREKRLHVRGIAPLCGCKFSENILVGSGFAHGVQLSVHHGDLLRHGRDHAV